MVRSAFCLLAILVARSSPAQTPPPGGWVVLPAGEYRDLRARTLPPDPVPPPVETAIARTDCTLRIAENGITGEIRLVVDVFRAGWVSVAVPGEPFVVRAARLDGRAVAILQDREPRIVLSRAGRSTITLDVMIPADAAGPGATSLLLPGSDSIASYAITRTGADDELRVDGGFIAERSRSGTDTRWVVHGRPRTPLALTWQRAADDSRARLPLQTRARVMELVTLGEDVSQVTASVTLDVTQGQAREAALAVSDDLTVNQVAGPMVADWSVERGRLSITFLEAVTSGTTVQVSGDVRAPREGALAVPLVRVPSAIVESGGVAVDVGGAAEIFPGATGGLEATDPSDLRAIVGDRASPSMVAFRYTPAAGTSPRALPLTVTRYAAQPVLVANVEDARYDALATADGKLLVRSRFTVRNNQRSFLAVTLPDRSTLWSAALAGQPVKPGVTPGGALLLPLQKSRPGQSSSPFVVELLYLQRAPAWTGGGTARIALPAVDLPVTRTALLLHYPPRFSIEPQPGVFHVDAAPLPASPPPPPAPVAQPSAAEKDALQGFIDEARRSAARTSAGLVPLTIAFPSFGPVLTLAAELTPEGSAPILDVAYRPSKR